MRPRAIVLLSGGLDSTTCLAWAQARYECIAISFMYGQRSTTELDAARALTQRAGVEHRVINIDLGNLGGSALTDLSIDVPEQEQVGIPVTYVPARNTIFLSYALAAAEVLVQKPLSLASMPLIIQVIQTVVLNLLMLLQPWHALQLKLAWKENLLNLKHLCYIYPKQISFA